MTEPSAKLKNVNAIASRSNVSGKARSILAAMVGAVAISRSIPNDEEISRVLTAAQNQILTMLGVDELASKNMEPF